MQSTWAPLKPGDVVQLVAPSSMPPEPSNALEKTKHLLLSWGLKPYVSDSIFGADPDFPSLANNDIERLQDLKHAISNPEIAAIWCLYGGYGAIRLLPSLEQAFITPPDTKLFMGYSDMTLLHMFLAQKWQWNTLHCSSALQVAKNSVAEQDIKHLKNIIFGRESKIVYSDLLPMNTMARTGGATINSSIIGGNLTLVCRMIGSAYAVDMRDKILLLEDLNETFRGVDGMLHQLEYAGYFQKRNKPAAIILGSVTAADSAQQAHIEAALAAFSLRLDKLNIPVVQCMNIGHGSSNHPITLGSKVTLASGLTPELTLEVKTATHP